MQNKAKPGDDVIIIVDTAQIQPYIFNSNRLRENIGASDLVRLATETWARDAADGLPIDEIYAAGGNYLAQARYEDATKFAQNLSKRVIESAPDLQLVIGIHKVDANESLYKNVQNAFAALAIQKQTRAPSAPLLGLGVTVMCQSTGLPATQFTQAINDDETSRYPASAAIIAKRKQVSKAKEHLQEDKDFKDILGHTFAFPSDFDDLGRSHGDQSFIAIVHADGNGMGDRIRVIGEGETDQQYKGKIKAFSNALEQATLNAIGDVLQALIQSIKREERRSDDGKRHVQYVIRHNMLTEGKAPQSHDEREITRIVLKDVPADRSANLIAKGYAEVDLERPFPFERTRVYLPFVPIVIGGDDVTFVCDGRLGLSLAKLYLERFNHHTQNLPDKPAGQGAATACAGVAIVKTHYPFARAYQLAESLCQSAKNLRKSLKQKHAGDFSALDWHYAISGLSGDIEEIRKREYTARWHDAAANARVFAPLVQRPLTIGHNPQSALCTWDALKKGIDAFQHENWLSRRNKLKALREVLRQGPEAVERFRVMYGIDDLPDVGMNNQDLRKKGWVEGTCGFFDAIELADLYVQIPLKETAAVTQPEEPMVA